MKKKEVIFELGKISGYIGQAKKEMSEIVMDGGQSCLANKNAAIDVRMSLLDKKVLKLVESLMNE